MPSRAAINDFLKQRRIAVVGVSRDSKEFSNGLFRMLKQHGYDVVPVNRNATEVEGSPCYASVNDVPTPVDGVLVMVPASEAAAVVQDCQTSGVKRVWLYRGGGPGAVSPEAVALARHAGMSLVDGACPYMFLDKGWVHRLHGFFTRLTP